MMAHAHAGLDFQAVEFVTAFQRRRRWAVAGEVTQALTDGFVAEAETSLASGEFEKRMPQNLS